MDIYGAATPTVGTLATGGNLTLKSNSSGKGRIGIIGASGALTGNVTVEVYKPAGKTGWTNLCSGGVTGKMFSDWNMSFAITCSTCPDGSSAGGVPFTSVYEYNETLGSTSNSADPLHYTELLTTATPINSYKGYWVYLGNNTPNTTAITIPLTGGVNTKNSGGNYTLTRTGATAGPETGWNLISNPYPSPILVSQIIASAGASNIDNTLYGYDPDMDNFKLFTAGGTFSVIPMGQAFQVRSVGTSVAITPSETWKTTFNSNLSIEKTASASNYAFNDFLLDLKSSAGPSGFSSQAFFAFGSGYTTGFDNGNDAYFIAGAVDPNSPVIYSISNNETFIKNALPTINGVVSVPVKVQTGYAGTYTINPVNMNMLPAGACVALYDIAKNITHDLKTGAYTTTIAAGATTPQFELKITVNQTAITSNVVNPTCANAATGSIKAQGTTGGPWNYTWKNSSNTIIKTALNKASADTLKNVTVGTYFVDVNTVGSCDNANATFNVQSTTPAATALFTANTTTVDASSNVPVSFTNNSSNAVTYSWNFGDGSPLVTTANATHAFNTPGTYNVVLTATGPCGDVSTASTQIDALLVSGIADKSISQDNMFVSKDENGVFVQLNFDQITTADINVTNVLGQVIINKKQVTGDKTKLYLMVPENEKVLFVTVIANGQKVTKKLIN
ncbi:MAG: PKD domain-containing protein [Bacteroidetes bacterium]|nr:PKD domain-containing protein [Bacteroidota bacterium]